jgi:hypothetical protein
MIIQEIYEKRTGKRALIDGIATAHYVGWLETYMILMSDIIHQTNTSFRYAPDAVREICRILPEEIL